MVGTSAPRKTYKRAPIIEAIVDFRFIAVDDFDFLKLDSAMRGKFSSRYPNIEKQIRKEFRIDVTNPAEPPSVVSHEVLRLASLDGKKILHLKPDNFTFSQLAPYECWDNFVKEVRAGVKGFLDQCSPRIITRVAVRFINRFDFPGPSVDLSEYLKIYPQMPPSFELNSFTMQSIIPLDDIKSMLVVRQALVAPHKPDTVSILLDFDLFNEEIRDNIDRVWDFLEELQRKKNQIFESSITDKTRDLIL